MADKGTSHDLADAPNVDDPRKPDSPRDVSKPSWKYVLRKTLREFTSDQCTDIAAALTYYAVLAIFPALIALVSLLGVFGQTADALLEILEDFAPQSAVEVLRGPIEQFSSSPAAGVALVVGIALAIWSASGYVGAFSRAMNRIYEIDEGRTFFALKPVQLLVTLVGIVMILLMTIMLAISGPVTDAIGSTLGLGETVRTVWDIAKWPVIALILVLMIAILYYATPNVKQPKFRWLSTGALIALVVLVIASVGFAFYVATFANYDSNYGSLGGVVVFLLWLWIANIALLFGAEFDAELERGRQLQGGIAAEENIQLPPRGTKKSEKAAALERKDVELGRDIRRKSAAEQSLRETGAARAADDERKHS
ncbi:YihY/virulence factor BrkB family protein [Marisediminicola sp. LYQ134]|uniref:YihY/virulence factor BrkB family protein n=1 Tax=Marisediminicola sp. LYQ134 TaxID=3391061 RepID=UPI003983A765